MRYSGEYKQKQMLNQFEQSLKDMGKGESGTSGDSSTSSVVNNSTPDNKPNSVDTNSMIGELIIPKINLRVVVAEGTELSDLRYAVGHFKGTALPGEKGNFCVAGHRNYTYSEYFNRLDELVNGDQIVVKTKKGEFTYIVYDKQTVTPDKVSVLDSTKDSTCTLITCTPIRVATHRLVISGRLKS
jgi:LPXTG-site transpeptidase (sortase) family protein